MAKAYRADYSGIGEMLCSEEMQAEMLRRADKMKEAAIAEAPFYPKDTDGDHYKDHFHTDSGVQHGKTDRAVGKLLNDHPAAFVIEYGQRKQNKNTPAHHTLTRALDAAKE